MATGTKVLKISGLTKRFGKITAVENLELNVREGQVYGILGPNGSGKTTTLGIILDVVSPTRGGYEWFGGKNPVESRKSIGSILETPCFYPYLSAVQNLRVVAHIKQCGTDNIDQILKKVNLFERKDDNFKTFSLGMKQRLSIAAALLSDPPVLILDEPTNGLDPEGIAEVRHLIAQIAQEGKTIIMASHLLDEVQKVCTDFCVLRNGRKLHEGAVQEILGETNQVLLSATDNQKLKELISSYPGNETLTVTNTGDLELTLKEGYNSESVNQYCHENGVILKKLITRTHSLEQEFLKILREEAA
jgi:ABC-2 type transport system ATP-binding protein